jgi:hypothetical protein
MLDIPKSKCFITPSADEDLALTQGRCASARLLCLSSVTPEMKYGELSISFLQQLFHTYMDCFFLRLVQATGNRTSCEQTPEGRDLRAFAKLAVVEVLAEHANALPLRAGEKGEVGCS